MTIPTTMHAVAIDGFGGPEVLTARQMPVPQPGPGEILIKVAFAGVGVWDAGERSGAMAAMFPESAKRFPRVIGGDGSGTIAALGAGVTGFSVGDQVYGTAFTNPQGGFYGEYAAVPASQVARLPQGLDLAEASALAITGVTALRGLADTLHVEPGDRILVFGASGGVGHPAVQLAKALGASVLAVVSNEDGAALARAAGADVVVDSTQDELSASIEAFAPAGLDSVLAAVNGAGLDAAIAATRNGGRVAFPHGVQPEPVGRDGVEVVGYDGIVDRDVLDRLNGLIESRPFSVHIFKRFPLEAAAEAHTSLAGRHLGRMILVASRNPATAQIPTQREGPVDEPAAGGQHDWTDRGIG